MATRAPIMGPKGTKMAKNLIQKNLNFYLLLYSLMNSVRALVNSLGPSGGVQPMARGKGWEGSDGKSV